MKNKLILFGGSDLLLTALKICYAKKIDVEVFTAPRHVNETFGEETIKKTCASLKIKCTVTENPERFCFAAHNEKVRVTGLSFGAAWRFSNKTIREFEGNLFDFMCIDVPRYRGGAHHSWQILQQETDFAICIQKIILGENNFQKGPVVSRLPFKISNNIKLPQEYFDLHKTKSRILLNTFIDNLGLHKSERPLLENQASYYPFLLTSTSGWINWSWDAAEVVNFINAFSKPYSGAQTLLGNKTVSLLGTAQLTSEYCHPFAAGLLIKKDCNHVTIGANKFMIKIELFDDLDLALGARFWTPQSIFDKVMRSHIEFDACGPRVTNFDHD